MVIHNVENHNVFGFQNALVNFISKNDETILRKILKPETKYIFPLGEENKAVLWVENSVIFYFTNKETNYEGDTTELVKLVLNEKKSREDIIKIIGDAYKKVLSDYNKEKNAQNKEKTLLIETILKDIGFNYVEINKLRS